ncbi:hypothetical protein F0267_07760 [Vibrio coralliilyticus]|nr:DUF6228 family protein [Vibrio coralliilyticus]NOH38127.1 hypothetical protein [Vibrio coralliilyticus]NOH55160.1 hypothetical protein [Vibrio coralliilyticus]
MMKSVVLKSAETSSKIRLFDRDGDYFHISYQSPCISYSKRIWGYSDAANWIGSIRFMAENWKGWDGKVLIQSIEKDLSLTFTCDFLGHVSVLLSVCENQGPELWKAKSELKTTTVAMESFHSDMVRFFS